MIIDREIAWIMRTGDDTCNLHEVKLLLIMWTNCTVRYSTWRCLMAHRNGVCQRNSAVSREKSRAVFSLGYVKSMSEEMFRKDRGPVRISCPRKSQPYYKKTFIYISMWRKMCNYTILLRFHTVQLSLDFGFHAKEWVKW